jgi:hypothetical protein
MKHRTLLPWLGVFCGALLIAAGLVSAFWERTTSAQAATPTAAESPLANLGYPELRLIATDEGFEAPREVSAGRYLVVLENQKTPGSAGSVSDVNLLQLPAGVALDQLNALLGGEAGSIPDWFGGIVSLGGFNVDAGETGYAVIDLSAGEWFIGIGDTNPYTALTVTGHTGATPTPMNDPESDITVHLSDFAFDLPDELPVGRLVWHAENVGTQQHELVIYKTPDLLTVEQVIAVLSLPEGSAPPAGVPDPSTFELLSAGLKTMSPGRELWVEMDFAPGSYVALCLNVDAATGAPHAAHGMIHVFTVGDE